MGDTPQVIISAALMPPAYLEIEAGALRASCTGPMTVSWRLPAPARTGPITVIGPVITWERKGIWIVVSTDGGSFSIRRPTDLDGDGRVDAADLSVLLGDWGMPEPRSDLNIDGVVDGVDHAILLGAWTYD